MTEPWLLKLAWQTALQTRTCPPDNILSTRDDFTRKHIQACVFCQERLEHKHESGAWQEIGRHLPSPLLKSEKKSPLPGEVWSIDPALAGWGPKNRFYNPPLVLVLEQGRESNHVLVCQLYWDTELLGPDDIYISDEIGFAEAWNTYSFCADDLDKCLGKVPDDELESIRLARNKDLESIETDSVLYYFRELELEVGSFFAQKSIQKLLRDHSWQDVSSMSVEELLVSLKLTYPHIAFPEQINDPRQVLALARFSSEQQALAAADGNQIQVNYVILTSSGLELGQTLVQITYQKYTEDGLFVAGRLDPDLEHADNIYAWWDSAGHGLVPADEQDLEPGREFFRVFFRHLDKKLLLKGRLVLLIEGYAGF
jgi:hypothetical protein